MRIGCGVVELSFCTLAVGVTEAGKIGVAAFCEGGEDALSVCRRYLPQAECRADPRAAARALPLLRSWVAGGDVPDSMLDPRGTAFQQAVWRALRRIPRGQTRSYREIAVAIGNPSAVRAVGNACGANPVALLIPCHRAIASDGGLGGFAGGLAMKRALLRLEGADCAALLLCA